MANITNVPDYTMLVDTRHHQQSMSIGTSRCLASMLCTITTSWPTSPWRRKLESFSRDLEIAEGTLPKWRTSGAKPEDCPRLGLFTHPSTLGGFTGRSKQGFLPMCQNRDLASHQNQGLPHITPWHPLIHSRQHMGINYSDVGIISITNAIACYNYKLQSLPICLKHLGNQVSNGWSVMQILIVGFGLLDVSPLWPLALSWPSHPSTLCAHQTSSSFFGALSIRLITNQPSSS